MPRALATVILASLVLASTAAFARSDPGATEAPAAQFKAGAELAGRLRSSKPAVGKQTQGVDFGQRVNAGPRAPWVRPRATTARGAPEEAIAVLGARPAAVTARLGGNAGNAIASGVGLLGYFERHGHALLADGTLVVVGQRPNGALLWQRSRAGGAGAQRPAHSEYALRVASGARVAPEVLVQGTGATALRVGSLEPGRYQLTLPRAAQNGEEEGYCWRYLELLDDVVLTPLPLDDSTTICVPPPPEGLAGLINIEIVPATAYSVVRDAASR